MFNAEKPSLEELPSSKQLLRSTIMAAAAALVILVTIVLPAEYGLDPTGVGRVLGLTEMGEIKQELSEEAEQDHGGAGDQSSLFERVLAFAVPHAHAQDNAAWADVVEFTLQPDDTNEVKMTMNKDDVVEYQMVVTGGRVNYDLHGHGGGNSISYEKGRGSTGSEGEFTAAFPGGHGWFWRNRDSEPATVTLRLKGTYSDLRQGE
ncbi:MAG: transmembrane anchor protein [Alphaproteobacteria bacterium]